MQTTDFYHKNKENLRLFYRHWQASRARGVVCIVHGLGEHIERYDHVAGFFSARGLATLGFDHQGHGRSGGKRGHSNGLESMLDDVSNLLGLAGESYPGLPVFLYGHSMGGNLVLNHLLRRKPAIAGLIATAPWIRLPEPPSPALVFFGKLMNRVFPSLTQPNNLDTYGLSNDPAVVKAYLDDPLVHDRISVRAGTELLQAAHWLDRFEGVAPCPILLMHGGQDLITSPVGTADFARRISGDVTWKRWEGLKHEIHNEAAQGEVLAYLVEWIGRFV